MDRLSRAWGTVSHLKAVKDTEELRKVRGRGRFACSMAGACWLDGGLTTFLVAQAQPPSHSRWWQSGRQPVCSLAWRHVC